MIVYGDPNYPTTISRGLQSLRERVRGLASGILRQADALEENANFVEAMDTLRTLLIEAGQWEQTAMDAFSQDVCNFCRNSQALTDGIAGAFDAACHARSVSEWRKIGDALSALLPLLDGEDTFLHTPVMVKLPEGFAFYTLYPERYAIAAQQWTQDKTAEIKSLW